MFVVHTIPGSPYARAVLAALEEKSAPWRLAPLKRGPRPPEYLARNPFGKMPTVEHDGFWLYETQAILRYLDRIAPGPALTPADPREAARMDQVMNIVDWYLFQGFGNILGFERVVKPLVLGLPPNDEACAASLPAGRRVLGELARLLGDRAFFGGGQLSLADLLAGPHLDLLATTPEWPDLAAPHAQLGAWLDRMRARSSFQATTMPRLRELAAA